MKKTKKVKENPALAISEPVEQNVMLEENGEVLDAEINNGEVVEVVSTEDEKNADLASPVPEEIPKVPVESVENCDDSAIPVPCEYPEVHTEETSEPVEIVQSVGVVEGVEPVEVVEPVNNEETVTETKKARRGHGSGSLWRSANGKYGICIQLGKTEDKKKLRHVAYFKTQEEAEKALDECLGNLDKTRAEKLAKLAK